MINSGIYGWFNLINNKVYIGSTSVGFNKRKNQHITNLKRNKHHTPHFQAAWNKYGKDNFEFRIIERCHNDVLLQREKSWIKYYFPNIYNTNLDPKQSPMFGKRHSIRSKNKMSKANIGRIPWNKNKKATKEEIEKNRIAHIGLKCSLKTRKKMSQSHIGLNTWMKGRKPSLITRKRISEGLYKSILKIDPKTNKILKKFKSINDALDENNINGHHVGEVCCGKRITAGGFKWRYV